MQQWCARHTIQKPPRDASTATHRIQPGTEGFEVPNRPALKSLDSQALAALGTTSTNDGTAATGFHADQEAMGSFAANHGRLICAFHLKQLLWVNR